MKRVMLVLIFFHRQCYAWPLEAYFSIVRYMFIVGSISEVCWLTIVPPEERAMRQRGTLGVLGRIYEFHFKFIYRSLGSLQI